MNKTEIISGTKAIAKKLSANIEIQEYNQYNWTAIRIYYGSGLFERFIALLSIPHDNPVLRVFENDKPRIFKDFAEFEEYARKNAEIQKNIRFDEIPNYN